MRIPISSRLDKSTTDGNGRPSKSDSRTNAFLRDSTCPVNAAGSEGLQHWLAVYSREFRSLRFFWALIQAQRDLVELRLRMDRLTVEATRSRSRAISRIDKPEAIPREMSSRSASVSASRERRRAAGGMPPRGNNTERMQLLWLVKKRVQSQAATAPPSTASKRHASRSLKAQIVVLASCQHHLYTADLHQVVFDLLRPPR
jgi:hypothetical protein